MSNKRIWVFGAGVSLDTFDYSQAGEDRLGINLAAYVVPDLLGAFTADYHMLRHYEKYLRGMPVYTYKTRHNFDLPMMYVDIPLSYRTYSTQAAILMCNMKGYDEIYMVGFDSRYGNNDYSIRIKAFCEECPFTNLTKPRDFAPINICVDKIVGLRSKVIWMHG